MKKVFDISSGQSSGEQYRLLAQVGEDHFAYALLDQERSKIDRIVYMTFDYLNDGLDNLTAEFVNQNIDSVVVSSAFPQALLVPQKYSNNDVDYLDAVYDLPDQEHLRDTVKGWQLATQYLIPSGIYQFLKNRFSKRHFCHAYTALIEASIQQEQPVLLVNFTTERFSVLLKKNQQVHLAQIYSYKTPLDVVYFLLKICYEFQVQQTEVLLQVSGFIERESNLFTELYNYFLNVEFAAPPAMTLPSSDVPQHYFTSLYNLAQCAS